MERKSVFHTEPFKTTQVKFQQACSIAFPITCHLFLVKLVMNILMQVFQSKVNSRSEIHITTSQLRSQLYLEEDGSKSTESIQRIAPKVSVFRRVIHGWTYQVYPVGLGTSAVYILLHNLTFESHVSNCVQVALLLLNMIIFTATTLILGIQAIMYPSRAISLISNPLTTIFVPFMALDIAGIILGLINHAIPAKLITWQTIETLFFMYIVFSLLICIPLILTWYDKRHDINTFSPAWAFLLFPLMLVGVVASRVLSVIPLHSYSAVRVLFLGYFFQGLGTSMTFFYLPIYLSRIMQTGFMEGHQANGAFVAGGPPGFTAVAFISLGRLAPTIFKENDLHEMLTEEVGQVFFGIGVLSGIFLLGLCSILFLMAVIPYYKKLHKSLNEVLGMWATTFPNVGMTVTLRLLGDLFRSKMIYVIQDIMTLFVCCAYVVAFSCTSLAIYKGKILLSSKEEVARDSSRVDVGDASELA